MSGSARRRAIALVTGAGKRLGRTIALDLADQGFDVAVHYGRSATEADVTAAEIRSRNQRAFTFQADLASEADVEGLIPAVEEMLGPVTVLVNSAATFVFDRPATVTKATWDRQLAINLRAPFVLIQSLAAHLPADARAAVVNLIDQRVLNLTPNYTSYTVSKTALLALTRHLAIALAPRIRVNGVGPGLVLPAPGMAADDFAAMARAMPLERGPTPQEIAAAVRFLIGSEATTGQMIAVDGGHHLGWRLPDPTSAA